MRKLQGNGLMLVIGTCMVLFMGIIFLAHRVFGLLSDYAVLQGITGLSGELTIFLYVLLIIPVVLLLVTFIVYKQNAVHNRLPLLLTLLFTFTSIGMIASGNGLVEYHFSIFMMLAFIAYFRSVFLMAVSTVIFALQHFGGYFFFPELLCGTENYRFSLLLIHAIFLILSALANIVLILHAKQVSDQAQKERKQYAQQFEEVMKKLRGTSSSILAATAHMESGSSTMKGASEQITAAAVDLNDGAEDLQRSIQTNVQYVEQMATVAEELNASAGTVKKSADETVLKVSQGTALMDNAEQQFLLVKQTVAHLESLLTRFQSRIKDIGGFVTDISVIADQTNLLALNASIEAARAGDAGRGFAVVAGEVRKLAGESDHSAKSIRDLVLSIEKESTDIFKEIGEGVKEVDNGAGKMKASREIFDVIKQSMLAVQEEVHHMSNVSETVSNGSIEMSVSMEEIGWVSEESLTNSQRVSAAAEHQGTAVKAFADVSDQLRGLSTDLSQLVHEISHRHIEE